jgi:hypothetical protein
MLQVASHLQVLGSLPGHKIGQELEEEDQRLLAAVVVATCAPKGGLEREKAWALTAGAAQCAR